MKIQDLNYAFGELIKNPESSGTYSIYHCYIL